MNEETLYNANGVTVTTTRFEVPGRMFAMASISGVRIKRTSFSIIAVTAILIGAAVMFVGRFQTTAIAAGGVFALVGLGMSHLSQRSILFVTTSGGEVKALTHSNAKFVSRVESAIKKAITARG